MYNNKITHIINCAPNEVPNHFENQGIVYLNIQWREDDSQILFDSEGQTLGVICNFIDTTDYLGESV